MTVSLDVVTLKRLLLLQRIVVANMAAIQFTHWQKKLAVFFKDPDLLNNMFLLSMLLVIDDEVRNGQLKFGGDLVRYSREICARVETGSIGKKLRGFWKQQHTDTFTVYLF